LRALINATTGGYADLVVDGVAAAPHWYPAIAEHQADWYVVSCHKLFGPTLGAICGRRQTGVRQFCNAAGTPSDNNEAIYKLLEVGTLNYEACSGIIGLGDYFADLSSIYLDDHYLSTPEASCQTPFQSPREGAGECRRDLNSRRHTVRRPLSSEAVLEAYRRIRIAEQPLAEVLMSGLKQSTKVRIIEVDQRDLNCLARLPVVSFRHEVIRSSQIVEVCSSNGIVCRYGCFLSNSLLPQDLDFDDTDGVVRFSLVHYNTMDDIDYVMKVLGSIPEWF
jgi:selenocysteine lyase/cysteine desulfurase